MASSALFAGETLFYEPFDSPESVAKYSSGAKLSFEKGKRGESGSLKSKFRSAPDSGDCRCRSTYPKRAEASLK